MKTNRAKIIHAGHIGNPRLRLEDSQDKGFTNPLTSLDITGEGVVFLPSQTTFHTSPVLCKYQKDTCPKNVPKYSMKCIYHKNECSIKKYFDRYRPSDLIKLGIGARV